MKLATTGTSAITRLALDSIKDVDGIEAGAAYSRNLGTAKALADEYHIPKVYDDFDELVSDPDIDTIYIATPNTLHYPQAKKALEAGKNVVLEKPFASTREQAEDLFATAEKNNVMIFEAITNIHTPNFGLLRDNLSMLGNLKQVVLNFSQYSSRYDRYKDKIITNAFDPKYDGGALTDINIYNIHFANELFGKPESVSYFPVFGWNGIDTSGTLILDYPDFVVTCIGAKDSSSPYECILEGDEGTFLITGGSSGIVPHVEFKPVAKDADDIVISIDQGPHMTYEFMDFMIALAENNQEMYEKYKKETLDAMDILCEAKAQRDAKKK